MRDSTKTAAETRWHQQIADFARNTGWLYETFGSYSGYGEFQIQHIEGAKACRKIYGAKVKIGQWYCIPVPIALHDVQVASHENHPLNVTRRKKAFEAKFGTQYDLWRSMIDAMVVEGYEIPFENDVIEAVKR